MERRSEKMTVVVYVISNPMGVTETGMSNNQAGWDTLSISHLGRRGEQEMAEICLVCASL